MPMQGPPPPARGMGPQDYYATLISQGLRPYEAYQAVQANFGPPKTPQQQAESQASAEQGAALAQTGGTIVGLIGTRYVVNNAGTWIDKLTGKPAPPNVVSAIRTNAPTTTTNVGTATSTPTSTPQPQPNVESVTVNTPAGPKTVPKEIANDQGFMSNVDWMRVAQGAVGLAQLYQAYKAWQKGQKDVAVMQGAQGGVNVAAAAGSETAKEIVPYLSAGIEVYKGTAAQFDKNMSEEDKAYAAAMAPARTAAAYYTAGASSLVEGYAYDQWGGTMRKLDKINKSWVSPIGLNYHLIRAVGSKKGGAQVLRDKVRDTMQEQGMLDQNWQGTLADGTKYDFGKDGKSLKWKELDKVAAAQPNAWDAAVSLADPLVAAYGLQGQKASDVAGWLANAAVSNAKNDPNVALNNMRHFAKQQGLNFDTYQTLMNKALSDKKISEQQYSQYMTGAERLFQPQQKTISQTKIPSSNISTRPPAALPPSTPPTQIPPQAKQGKESIGDVLRRIANKQ